MFFQLPRICHWGQYTYNSICFVSALLLLVVSMLTPAPQLRKYRSRQGIYATYMQLICSSGRISLHLLFVIAANIADNCFKLFVCLLAIDASATFF